MKFIFMSFVLQGTGSVGGDAQHTAECVDISWKPTPKW